MSWVSDHYAVEKVDFTAITWEQQVKVSNASDLILGVHGNGLSNLLWANPSASVLEIFPASAHHYDYQLLSEIVGVKYIGIQGTNVYSSFCRVGPALGQQATNVPIESLSKPTITLALTGLKSRL